MVRNIGRAAIQSAMYDRDCPLQLHLGTPILEVLEATNVLETQPAPASVTDGDTLAVGPGLIGQRESLTYEFLVDGQPQLAIEHSLINVEVA